MKHLFIVNPIAGKGKSLDYIPKIKEYFSTKNDPFFIEVTEYPRHATKLVKEHVSKDKYRVYSIGGDGTLNEVLNGIVGSDSSLAVIPTGSGNDFSKTLDYYCSLHEKDLSGIYRKQTSGDTILKKLINGTELSIDIGKINNKYFINISSLGFDAEVVYKSNKIKKLPLITGLPAYILSVLATLISYGSNLLEMSIDGLKIKKGVLLAAVANGRYYGGGMQAAPLAEIDDGFFDICLIEHVKRLKILRLFPKFIKGKHANIKEVSFFKGKNISIISKNKIALNVDGETDMVNGKIDFMLIPNAVKIVLPILIDNLSANNQSLKAGAKSLNQNT